MTRTLDLYWDFSSPFAYLPCLAATQAEGLAARTGAALSWRPMLLGAVFRRGAFRERTFRAYWAEDRDINDEAVLAELAGEDAGAFAALSARMQSPEIKKELATATQSAIDRGVFGAPTWLVDGQELFWGQDRIALVERALGH